MEQRQVVVPGSAACAVGTSSDGKSVPELHSALLAAQRRLRTEDATAIVQELRAGPQFTRQVRARRSAAQTQQKRRSTVRNGARGTQRLVFISAQSVEDAVLVRRLEDSVLAKALVILPDSHWTAVHPIRRAGQADETAVRLAAQVVELLQKKEANGTLFWLGTRQGKGRSYEELSEWIASMSDPATGNRYAALQLGATWWRRRFPVPSVPPRFTRSGEKVARNVLSTSCEPSSLLELLHQSNPQVFQFMT
ncbi:Hypothetical Protein FCC1311_076802 [Hondaea fermentalgiana]|uniref:Uncharacterized protein n=1 Tax=Hondaea fermentalgiana TaxID=2315210 RepID=A0A2R5GKL9_9STRA|nr:Hypothetical Protein FCC1311_076802 [Hondaea fermentalgiana]|eukprot:GBG31456.1 Hypothetical Protein FCC1311_076802 [Hondaea fermentalgiana]